MTGLLIINSFMGGDKYSDIYNLLRDAANRHGTLLEIKTTAMVNHDIMTDTFTRPDFVIFWDKDIYLAKRLEYMGIRLFNSSRSIEICDNKALTTLFLNAHDINYPCTVIAPKTFEAFGYNDLTFVDNAIDFLGLPIVIKEVYGSFGGQVYLADSKRQAHSIVKKLGCKDFIMQEFISSSRGKDIRINVVGGKAIASIMRYNDNDFRSNLTLGGNMRVYQPDKSFIDLAIKASQACGLDFAGVDVLFGSDGEPIICEVNSNPHFRTTLDCTGINLADHIICHITDEIKKITGSKNFSPRARQ